MVGHWKDIIRRLPTLEAPATAQPPPAIQLSPAVQTPPNIPRAAPIPIVDIDNTPAIELAAQTPGVQPRTVTDVPTIPPVNNVSPPAPLELDADSVPAPAVAANTTADHTNTAPPPPLACMLELDHVARRRIGENCPICLERMAGLPLNELVWCKSSCGQSVHVYCFAQWEDGRQNPHAPLTCVCCRGPWQPQCDCDTVEPSES